MTNVLPLTAQKELWRMYRARFVAAFALMMIALAFVAILALIPSYFALAIMAPTSDTMSSEDANASDMAALSLAQAVVVQIAPIISATTSPTDVIESVLSIRPRGLSVTHIAYVGGAPSQMILDGTASRAAINEYRALLAADKRFTSVAVPVGALVGAEGGRFSFTITGNF